MGETPWSDDPEQDEIDGFDEEDEEDDGNDLNGLEDVDEEDQELDPLTAELRDQVTGRVLGTLDDEQWHAAVEVVLDRYWPPES